MASLHQRALTIREETLGHEHPDVAASLNNLAKVYTDQSRHAEAEPLYKRSISILEKTVDPDHPHMALNLENYAQMLRKLGRNAEAGEMEVRAKAIRAKHARDNPLH